MICRCPLKWAKKDESWTWFEMAVVVVAAAAVLIALELAKVLLFELNLTRKVA
jgi:hypothetical protein